VLAWPAVLPWNHQKNKNKKWWYELVECPKSFIVLEFSYFGQHCL
jgi:hypothetical protein